MSIDNNDDTDTQNNGMNSRETKNQVKSYPSECMHNEELRNLRCTEVFFCWDNS